MDYSAPISFSRNYPRPSILSAPSRKYWCFGTSQELARGQVATYGFTSGRYALGTLAEALPSSVKVWLPAYHCPALVEPFIQESREVAFYSVTSSLEPDFEELNQSVNQGDVILGVRFFGFESGMARLASLAKQQNCLLIEDLAHAPYTNDLKGDFAITSLAKFFAIRSGATLCVNTHKTNPSILKVYQTLKSTSEAILTNKIRTLCRNILGKGKSPHTKSSFYSKQKKTKGMFPFSAFHLAHGVCPKLASVRRKNYLLYQRALEGLPHVRCLQEKLHDGVVPYVFPLIVENAQLFDLLKQNAIQVLRWEQLADTTCETSRYYRERLIQLPCHQDLTERDVSKIIMLIKEETAL